MALEEVQIKHAIEHSCRVKTPSLGASGTDHSEFQVLAVTAVIGLVCFSVILGSHHITDADLWAKLALGAHVWKLGSIPHHDIFAFTPTLAEYVDHEWGAGTIFFGLLKLFGPASLMWLKLGLALGTVGIAFMTGLRSGALDNYRAQSIRWSVLLLLGIPASACILLGFVPVIRSHTFTYFFFAATLFCLERIFSANSPSPLPSPVGKGRGEGLGGACPHRLWGKVWPALVIIATMLIWANVHGGFVAGLGTIAIYTGWYGVRRLAGAFSQGPTACFQKRRHAVSLHTHTILLIAALASLVVTCINPYGIKFWGHLLPAVLAKRAQIAEWQPLPLFATDVFMPFRILFLLVACVLVMGWKLAKRDQEQSPSFPSVPSVQTRSWTGLIMLAITAYLGCRSRRHAPFFGIAALAFAGPYAEATLSRVRSWVAQAGALQSNQQSSNPLIHESTKPAIYGLPESVGKLIGGIRPATVVLGIYALVALYAAIYRLPLASFQVLSPVGHDPVREADILSLAHAEGNLATPFHWGSYLAWRLHPAIKISMDGRYEAAYPESTFQLNNAFFDVTGPDWDRLTRQYPVDFVILDLAQERLRPQNLKDHGYVLIWMNEGCSALLALEKHAAKLRQVANQLPPTTINPLDADMTEKWWSPKSKVQVWGKPAK
jgi:hypothetical protein